MIKTLLNNHPLIIFFFSFAIVGVAIIFEHFGQYYACPLCILQRWAYIFCGLTALFLMAIKKDVLGVRKSSQKIAFLQLDMTKKINGNF